MMNRLSVFLISIVLLLLIGGCAGRRAFERAENSYGEGDFDMAVARYAEAVNADPDRYEFRIRLQDARLKASRKHLEAGRRQVEKGELATALYEFQQAAALDPSSRVGGQEIKKVQNLLRAEELLDKARQFATERKFTQARDVVRQVLLLAPDYPAALEFQAQLQGERRTVLDGFDLDVASDKPITLKFKDADIRDVFNIVSKLSGINFLFDEDIRAQKVSIFLENATFAQALEVLLRLNDLDRKVLNAKTILVYPQTREKEKKFEDQVIQTFYLSNIDAKKAVNLLRTMLQLRKVYVHEELNALVIRETPEVIRLAEQILEAADRADSEVVFDLELVEIAHTDSLDIGPRLASYATTFGLAESGADSIGGSITTDNLSSLKFLYSIPSATFTLQKKLSDSEILANPKIRVKNKEKAKVHIGSREPIVTNTLTAAGDVTSTNVQYVDVGVKLDVEPVIQLDNSVVTKISLEVSSVSGRQKIGSNGQGGEALTLSTTNAQTSLILQDGQQTIIGGLIRDDFTKAKDTIPLLGQIPFLGNLISGHKRDKVKREIVLSITPHIVKNIEMPRADVATIWSGGEDDLQTGPRFGSFAKPLEPVANMALPTPAPAVGTRSTPREDPPAPLMAPEIEEMPAPAPLDELPAIPGGGAIPPVADAGMPVVPATEQASLQPATPIPLPLPTVPPEAVPQESLPPESVPPESVPPESVPPEEAVGHLQVLAPPQVAAGEEFSLRVGIQGARALYSAPLFIFYDAQSLEFVGAQEGDFLRTAGQSTIFTTIPNSTKGELIVGYKQGVGGTGASGDGSLFTLDFRAKAPGEAKIALDRLNFRTPAGNRLPIDGASATVEVR